MAWRFLAGFGMSMHYAIQMMCFVLKTTITVLSRVLTQLLVLGIILITGPEACARTGQGDVRPRRSWQAQVNLEVES